MQMKTMHETSLLKRTMFPIANRFLWCYYPWSLWLNCYTSRCTIFSHQTVLQGVLLNLLPTLLALWYVNTFISSIKALDDFLNDSEDVVLWSDVCKHQRYHHSHANATFWTMSIEKTNLVTTKNSPLSQKICQWHEIILSSQLNILLA